MAFKTYVSQEDQPGVDAILEAIVGDGAVIGTAQLGDALACELRAQAETGSPWADSMLYALARDGASEYVKKWLGKRERSTIKIASNGAVLDIPARVGVRVRTDEGRPERFYQRPLWWELTWPEFEEHIFGLQRQLAKVDANLTAKLQVLALRDEFPDTLTPGEACDRKGIDPRQFGIEEDVS